MKGGEEDMTAEHYLREKERLSQALHGRDNLDSAVSDIADTLKKYGMNLMPETAFDVMCFTLETLHLNGFNLSKFVP